jgi:hypothetical protein
MVGTDPLHCCVGALNWHPLSTHLYSYSDGESVIRSKTCPQCEHLMSTRLGLGVTPITKRNVPQKPYVRSGRTQKLS